jgi:CBS domain-containing protein
MMVQEVMSSGPACCTPEQPVREAAKLMHDHDCGCIPVEDSRTHRLVGVLTDRDIAMRVVAKGRSPDTPVKEAMSRDPSCCHADDSLVKAEEIMAERQVRRVPIVDEDGCCVGIVAQADLARASQRSEAVSERELARVVERISEPDGASRSQGDAHRRPSSRH